MTDDGNLSANAWGGWAFIWPRPAHLPWWYGVVIVAWSPEMPRALGWRFKVSLLRGLRRAFRLWWHDV